jgi:hypothetical protein
VLEKVNIWNMAGLNNNKIKTLHLYKLCVSWCLAGALPGQSSQQRNRPAARVTILPAVSCVFLAN